MENFIVGKVHKILPIERIEITPNIFIKQKIVLDCSTQDTFTGKEYPNYPMIELSGQCLDDVEFLSLGDLVKIHFRLSGRFYKDKITGEEKNFTLVRGYKIENGIKHLEKLPEIVEDKGSGFQGIDSSLPF